MSMRGKFALLSLANTTLRAMCEPRNGLAQICGPRNLCEPRKRAVARLRAVNEARTPCSVLPELLPGYRCCVCFIYKYILGVPAHSALSYLVSGRKPLSAGTEALPSNILRLRICVGTFVRARLIFALDYCARPKPARR